jgi:hypothetical protein
MSPPGLHQTDVTLKGCLQVYTSTSVEDDLPSFNGRLLLSIHRSGTIIAKFMIDTGATRFVSDWCTGIRHEHAVAAIQRSPSLGWNRLYQGTPVLLMSNLIRVDYVDLLVLNHGKDLRYYPRHG